MIKSNELRISNWVMLADTYWKIGLGEEIDVHSFEPIPLTPEILEKAGFVLDEGVGWWFLKGVEPNKQFPVADTIDDGVKWVYNNTKNVHCKYLHQLQNLFHSLTGEELTIEDLNVERSVATKSNSSNSVD